MQPIAVLAFSGGLDTSYCVPHLADLGYAVHTVFVNTGGATEQERTAIRDQAIAVGALEHHEIDAREAVFDRFVSFLIQANALRGAVYPLSVAAERTQQAMSVVDVARKVGATTVAHGSTGAGNDQIRFDSTFRILASELEVLTPIREGSLSREATIDYLKERGLPVPPKSGDYSINQGLWGTTWGGGWTHDSWAPPPAELLDPPEDSPLDTDLVVHWRQGVPVAIDERELPGPQLVEELSKYSVSYGIGKGIHVGETALGIRGRIGFEAGAALMLIAAHRELEKLVLTKWQSFWKDQLGNFYGDRLHEASTLAASNTAR